MTDTGALHEWLYGVIAGKKQPVALMVVGEQASGKTTFARALMERVGNVNCAVAHQMPGQFNGLMVEKSLVVFDEWADDLGKLIPYITNPTVEVERKGWSPTTQDNRTNYLLLVQRNPILHGRARELITTTPDIAMSVLESVRL